MVKNLLFTLLLNMSSFDAILTYYKWHKEAPPTVNSKFLWFKNIRHSDQPKKQNEGSHIPKPSFYLHLHLQHIFVTGVFLRLPGRHNCHCSAVIHWL